jgi:hypothetical protein
MILPPVSKPETIEKVFPIFDLNSFTHFKPFCHANQQCHIAQSAYSAS